MMEEADLLEDVHDDVLLAGATQAFAHDAHAFVDAALRALLDETRWSSVGELLDNAPCDPARNEQLAHRVLREGVMGLSEQELLEVFSARSTFEVVVAALRDVPHCTLDRLVGEEMALSATDPLLHWPISDLYHPTLDAPQSRGWHGVALAALVATCIGLGAVWWYVTNDNGPARDLEAAAQSVDVTAGDSTRRTGGSSPSALLARAQTLRDTQPEQAVVLLEQAVSIEARADWYAQLAEVYEEIGRVCDAQASRAAAQELLGAPLSPAAYVAERTQLGCD